MNEKWFSLGISETEQKLKTNAASGLSRKAARSAWYKEHRAHGNVGTLFVRKSKKVGKMVGEIICDFALIILLLAAVFAIAFGEKLVGITVVALILVNLSVSFGVYYRSERAMEQMNLYFLPTAKVIRGGKLYSVSFENVVVGDVIILETGDIVPADARLVTSDQLLVAMRTSKDKYISLQKQAHGAVLSDENNPAKFVNIVHAGSVIEKGSARAIVYATGLFTYLGALTGGIDEFYSDNVPVELKKMKKICSKIGMISMLCILPFSIISLLLSYINNGNSTLSVAFLTALAISASSMTQLSCTACKIFFTRKIVSLSKAKNPAVVRTTDAFDKFGEIDYLFMLDGSAVTDGILHFDTAFTAEGEVKSFNNPTATMSMLFNMAALYTSAESNMLTVGINLPDRFKIGLEEFLDKGNTDKDALKIRYPIRSYMPGGISKPTDRVFYTDNDRKMVLDVSRTSDAFDKCAYAFVAGHIQPLTTVGADKLKHTYNVHAFKGKTVLVLTLSSLENSGRDSGQIFVGAVVLREGVDKRAIASINALKKRGVNVISFSGCIKDASVPQIPVEIHGKSTASKENFIKSNLPLIYKFGDFDTYYDFAEKEVLQLVNFAKSQGKRVGVIGFSDHAASVIESADVFISCAPIINVLSAKTEEELFALETAGAASSSSCIQTVKSETDVLIPRPNKNGGGISTLVEILSATGAAHKNLSVFFKYMIAAHFLRILMCGIPMILGSPILDARHILFCGFIMDITVLLMLANIRRILAANNLDRYKIKPLKMHLGANKPLMISVLCSTVVAIFLPMLMDLTAVFGHYLYRTEYLFCSMIWLHLLLAYYICYGSIFNIRSMIKNKILIGLFLGAAMFVILMSLLSPFGLFFEYIQNPAPYFIASFLPAIIFAVLMEFLPRMEKLK